MYEKNQYILKLRMTGRGFRQEMRLAGAVANVADSDRCRCNPKVPSSIPAGGKDFP